MTYGLCADANKFIKKKAHTCPSPAFRYMTHSRVLMLICAHARSRPRTQTGRAVKSRDCVYMLVPARGQGRDEMWNTTAAWPTSCDPHMQTETRG